MANFCKQCSIALFGEDSKDLAHIAGIGELAYVLCEGCGFIYVNNEGTRIDFATDKFPGDDMEEESDM